MVPADVFYDFFPIRAFLAVAWISVGLVVLFVLSRFTKGRARRWTIGALALVMIGPFAWSAYVDWRNLRDLREAYSQFQSLCYEKAYQRIVRRVGSPTIVVFSPPSGIKSAYGELFYAGLGPPRKWGKVDTVAARPAAPAEGTYEVRFMYVPEEREVSGTPVRFHGIRQEIIDVSGGQVLGERVNYLLGGEACLDGRWPESSLAFAEQVLGSRHVDRDFFPSPKPVEHLKARLISTDDVDVQLRDYARADVLPPGSEYDYDKREIRLPGVGKMPIRFPIAAYVEREGRYIFLELPHGDVRNRQPREVLFSYWSKTGEEIRNVFVQIPPGMDWIDGWGFDPRNMLVSDATLEFDLFGAKDRVSKSSDQDNMGRYAKRYRFRANLAGPLLTQ